MRKDFRRLETLYNLRVNVCQQIFCQRQINGFLVNCRCPDIRLLGGKTKIFLNQISGSLGRIKCTFRIAVGKFTGMIFVSLENACSPFRLGLLWRRPLFFCIGNISLNYSTQFSLKFLISLILYAKYQSAYPAENRSVHYKIYCV